MENHTIYHRIINKQTRDVQANKTICFSTSWEYHHTIRMQFHILCKTMMIRYSDHRERKCHCIIQFV